MNDALFVGVTVAFFGLTAWLAAFADRIMPAPIQREGFEDSAREDAR